MAPPGRRQAAEARGRRAERWARLWLAARGYRTLAERYRTPLGEIDLVMRRGGVLAFVEVKARADRVLAIEAVGAKALGRFGQAARLWLAQHPADAGLSVRFDLVLVTPGRLPTHLKAVATPPLDHGAI